MGGRRATSRSRPNWAPMVWNRLEPLIARPYSTFLCSGKANASPVAARDRAMAILASSSCVELCGGTLAGPDDVFTSPRPRQANAVQVREELSRCAPASRRVRLITPRGMALSTTPPGLQDAAAPAASSCPHAAKALRMQPARRLEQLRCV